MPTRNATGRSRRLSTGWPDPGKIGCVYTLHFERPIGNLDSPRGYAQHYTGWSAEELLELRLAEHRAGTSGVPLVKAFFEAGIRFEVVSVEYGVTRARENQLKLGSAARRCPVCKAQKMIDKELEMMINAGDTEDRAIRQGGLRPGTGRGASGGRELLHRAGDPRAPDHGDQRVHVEDRPGRGQDLPADLRGGRGAEAPVPAGAGVR